MGNPDWLKDCVGGNAGEKLLEGARTYAERTPFYGAQYQSFGTVMKGLFPGGVPMNMGPDDWNRLGLIVQCASKLARYAARFPAGGHADSAHDLMVYAAMLSELTHE